MKTSTFLAQAVLPALILCAAINSTTPTSATTNATAVLPEMYQLSNDSDFHFEILRDLGAVRYGGADVGEVLIATAQIVGGDMESFYAAFNDLGNRVYARAQSLDVKRFPISVRDSMFNAATYFRSADFYLHGNQSDPRIYSLWDLQTAAFNVAISLLPVPGKRLTLKGDGFEIPAIFYGVGGHEKRPTIIIGNGYDGSQEELYHMMGKAALERGYNVITYEGPGQPTVRRDQGLGFIPEWEKVVTPVVDYLFTRKDVDHEAIALFGLSFGGYLAPRASAFEKRLVATFAVDGILDFGLFILSKFGDEFEALFNAGNAAEVNEICAGIVADPTTPTSTSWFLEQGLWAFKADSYYDFLNKTLAYDLTNIINDIPGPVFVADAQDDLFFLGSGTILANALGSRATYHLFQDIDGAGEHCALGANVLQNEVVFGWFADVLEGKIQK